jgi:hypothetical protein
MYRVVGLQLDERSAVHHIARSIKKAFNKSTRNSRRDVLCYGRRSRNHYPITQISVVRDLLTVAYGYSLAMVVHCSCHQARLTAE